MPLKKLDLNHNCVTSNTSGANFRKILKSKSSITSVQAPRIYAIHDRALTIEFSTSISEEINLLVMRLHASLEEKSFDGFIESVPSYSSLTVYFNEHISIANVEAILLQRYTQCVESFSSTNSDYTIQSIKHIIPVCYDSSYGLSLIHISEPTRPY